MTSAIAQALECEDIATEVFGHLESEGLRRTLASAARVNRALSHPALAALWQTQNNILRLFRVVPSFRHEKASNTKVFYTDPSKEQWERFTSYARLVRCLDVYNVQWIHSSVWKAVTQYVGHIPLFPHLQRLERLHVDVNLPAESLHHLLPPTLQHVHLIPEDDGMQAALGQLVLSGLTHVHVFNIQCESGDGHRHLPFWTFVNMRILVIRERVELTPEKMRGLASLPHLRSLHMEVSSFTNESTGAPPYTFARLDTVTLKWKATLEDMTAFITSTSFPRLKAVDLNATRTAQDSGECAVINSILAKLARECAHSLCAVSFVLSTSGPHSDHPLPSDLQCMSDVIVDDLLQCTDLHTLTLSMDIPSALGESLRVYDRDIRRVMSLWPALRTFELDVIWGYTEIESGFLQRFPDGDPPPTVHTLVEFAQAHSQLKHLRLPYVCIPHTMVGDDGKSLCLDSLPVLDHGLESLHFWKWAVLKLSSTSADDRNLIQPAQATKTYHHPVFEFAYLLDRLFPRLHVSQYVNLRRSWNAKNFRPIMFTVNMILWMLQVGRSCRRPGGVSVVGGDSADPSTDEYSDDNWVEEQSDDDSVENRSDVESGEEQSDDESVEEQSDDESVEEQSDDESVEEQSHDSSSVAERSDSDSVEEQPDDSDSVEEQCDVPDSVEEQCDNSDSVEERSDNNSPGEPPAVSDPPERSSCVPSAPRQRSAVYLDIDIEDDTQVHPRIHSMLVGVVAQSLRKLRFYACLSDSYTREDCDLGLRVRDVLLPLLGCSGLRELQVSLAIPDSKLEFHDDDLAGGVVEAWPSLTCFVVRFPELHLDEFPNLSSCPPTVRTLAAFAQAHPRLNYLHWPYVCIPPDMVTEDENVRRDALPVLNHGLTRIHFETWGIYEPLKPMDESATEDSDREPSYPYGDIIIDFAFILFRLFPHLSDIHPAYYTSLSKEWMCENYEDIWSALAVLLSMLGAGEEGRHRQILS